MGKWYRETKWILLLMILCFPVGVFLLFKYGSFGKFEKVISVIVAASVIYTVCIMVLPKAGQADSRVYVEPLSKGEVLYIPEDVPKVESEENTDGEQHGEQYEGQHDEQHQEHGFVASRSGKKYHIPSCEFALRIKEENKISFSTEDSAISQGYGPCSKCLG